MRRSLAALVLLVLAGPACTRNVTDATAESTVTSTTVVDQPDDITTATSPATTSAPTTTTAPPSELVVKPYGGVGGVELGTDLDTALSRLTAVFGEPDADSGWEVGCSLDGDAENERIIRWGSLSTHFHLVDIGRLIAWTIDTEDGDMPATVVRLPGGSSFGEPMSAVAASNGLEVLLDGVFGAATVSQDGYALWGFPDELSAPLSLVGVPYVPVCE